MKRVHNAAVAVIAMACSAALAEVKPASVFTDHMVLQRDKAVRVWGTADAGKTVTVKIADHKATAKADDHGKWTVRLDKNKASETPQDLVISEAGGNTVTLTDVLFGDVWVASGQSNMEFHLERAHNAAEAVPAATDDKMRLLLVAKRVSDEPLAEQGGKWAVCTPDAAKGFSAVAYFFAKEIREREHVPVGVVGTYWGGTLAEAWTPKKQLDDPDWEVLWEKDRKQVAEFATAHAEWEKKVKEWEQKPAATRGRKPADARGADSPHRPAVLWNGMVQPLIPMSITGMIWYQGESNAARAEQYRTLFPTMIEGWREQFDQGDAPFLFVQLANFNAKSDKPEGSAWAELRDAQTRTLKLKNTGQALAIDVGNPTDIHPTDKQTVGKRLALAAERVAYGKDIESTGPTYKSMAVNEGKAKLKFTHAKGLAAKDGDVKGFAVAGEDKKFVPATATIDGETVTVSAPGVDKPAAVRYGWADSPTVNLYNAAGLPAVPFRTDDWPTVTAGKK